MRAGFIGWLAIIVNAIAFVPAGAHLFALPNKMRLAETDYSVAQSIYGGWALFGYVFLAALVINIIFATLLRGQTLPFVLLRRRRAPRRFLSCGLLHRDLSGKPANQQLDRYPCKLARVAAAMGNVPCCECPNPLCRVCCVSWAALLRLRPAQILQPLGGVTQGEMICSQISSSSSQSTKTYLVSSSLTPSPKGFGMRRRLSSGRYSES
jgi:hypothetical protein